MFVTQQHRGMLEQMASSEFCLIMPGNSQSSQRLTEAFLTGCIPVFVGPPWHALPLRQKVALLILQALFAIPCWGRAECFLMLAG